MCRPNGRACVELNEPFAVNAPDAEEGSDEVVFPHDAEKSVETKIMTANDLYNFIWFLLATGLP